MKIDETKLTAYAIDELSVDEHEAIDAQLTDDPDAREQVEQIRETARSIEAALQTESSRVAVGPQAHPAMCARSRTPWRLAAAASLAVAMGTGAIVIKSLHQSQQRVVASSNLKQTGSAFQHGLNEIKGVSPRVDTFDKLKHAEAALDQKTQAPLIVKEKSELGPETLSVRMRSSSPHDAKEVISQQVRDQRADAGLFGAHGLVSKSPSAANGYVGNDSVLLPTDEDAGGKTLSQVRQYKEDFRAVNGAFGTEHKGDIVTGDVRGIRPFLPDNPSNTESYDRITDKPFLNVVANPLSTFSIDVDTASYSNVRRFLNQNQLPPPDAVRIEELINYFPYGYKYPADTKGPFATSVEVADCPWNSSHRLARVGLKAKDISANERPASNLVFLLDVSGSMNEPNKLPLVKSAMRLLVEKLTENDHVTIVTYAGNSGLTLQMTNGMNKKTILEAIDRLEAGGSTNGGQGIQLAYDLATSGFIKGGANRVILATDGDFNVGITDQGQLTRLIEEKAKSGVFLSVLGFGMGNLKDSTMEKLADKGNGNYAYIDTFSEAKKVLVEQMSGTLVTVAKDVKIQIEFNPAVASSYRLIGYENRMLAKEDFNDDKKDAGEIGAGHTVTALYEIVPAGEKGETPKVDELKYQGETKNAKPPSGELMTLKLRYKEPDGETSKLIEIPVNDAGETFAKSSGDFKFTAAVAGFGMILRNSPHKGSATFGGVMEWAGEGLGTDVSGYRHEFVDLVRKAQAMKQPQ